MSELKPCPFCGCGDRRVGIRRMGSNGYRVCCSRCGSLGPHVSELVDYELKETWESNGYSQALVDVRNILRGESQNDEGVEDDERQ